MKKFFSIEFNRMIDITNDLFLEDYAQNSGISVNIIVHSMSEVVLPYFKTVQLYSPENILL